jgi:hypothetical protein
MKYVKTYRSKNEARAELQRRREQGENVVLDAYIHDGVIGYFIKEVQA